MDHHAPRSHADRWVGIFLILVIVAIAAIIVAVGGFAGSTPARRQSANSPENRPLGVYLEPENVPEDQRIPIAQSSLEELGIVQMTSPESFIEMVDRVNPKSIWIHASALETIPPEWISQIRSSSTVVVGINIPIESLGTHIGVPIARSGDWDPGDSVTFALYWEAIDIPYTNPLGEPATRGGTSWTYESFDSFPPEALVAILEGELQRIDSLKEGPEQTVPTPSS